MTVPLLAQALDTMTASDVASALLFWLFAAMAGASAVGVVVSRNIVRTAVCLLFTLVSVACLYFLLEAEFLAAVQLVVYAGGTLILIIFGVMLTSKSPFSRFEPKPVEVVIALVVGAILLMALVLGITDTQFTGSAAPVAAAAQTPGATVAESGYPVNKLGQALLGDYLVPFELASVLLLVVMIGAAYLAKARRRQSESGQAVTASQQARQWS